MTDTVTNEVVEVKSEASNTLFDLEDNESLQEVSSTQQQKEAVNTSTNDKNLAEPSEWYYDEKIKGEGIPPEWFNHKTFKNITEQARAYNEARKQLTQYSEKLKAFSGAPEKYEEAEEGAKNNVFAIGLKELGQKIGLNQAGFNDLLDIYNKTKEIEAEKDKAISLQQQKEELKKIGGIGKLKEIEAKFVNIFGDSAVGWLRGAIKSNDDYVNLERMVSNVSEKSRVPVSSMESSISTRQQAEELIRDPRWGKDREFTKKADKLLNYMLQSS